jgi:Fe-S-cluster containining protein
VKSHERLATLTWADVDRVSTATGLAPEAFSEWEWLDADHVQAWLDVHPAYVGYLGAAPRRMTLRALEGKCALLDPKHGCTLTEDQRPTACRIYPFDVGEGLLQVSRFGDLSEARRVVEKGADSACLAIEESGSRRALLKKLGMTEKKVRALAEKLRAEVAEHAKRERKAAMGRR